MPTVQLANPYRPCSLGSMDDASLIIFRQYNFPLTYQDTEHHCSADHDRIRSFNSNKADACIRKYTGSGEGILHDWFEKSSDEAVMSFIKEFLEADQHIRWTGYRIRGSVHKGNGSIVWRLELFAKHSKSTTEVYTGRKAPNVSKETVRTIDLLP